MDASFEVIEGGITAPRGFRAAGIACGIKANGKPDLAVVASDVPAAAAAVFTTNQAQAAPIVLSRRNLEQSGGIASAIVVNSGCANACTGDDGMRDARAMVDLTATELAVRPSTVLVASTGVIGVKLPMAGRRARHHATPWAHCRRRAAPPRRAPS